MGLLVHQQLIRVSVHRIWRHITAIALPLSIGTERDALKGLLTIMHVQLFKTTTATAART